MIILKKVMKKEDIYLLYIIVVIRFICWEIVKILFLKIIKLKSFIFHWGSCCYAKQLVLIFINYELCHG